MKPTPADYKAIFEDHRVGVAILEDLLARFIQPAVTEGGIDAVLKTFSREGQRRPLDFIMSQINRANGVEERIDPPEVST